jgi:hypothetical protein
LLSSRERSLRQSGAGVGVGVAQRERAALALGADDHAATIIVAEAMLDRVRDAFGNAAEQEGAATGDRLAAIAATR